MTAFPWKTIGTRIDMPVQMNTYTFCSPTRVHHLVKR